MALEILPLSVLMSYFSYISSLGAKQGLKVCKIVIHK
jgi:hypothetical protein